MRIMLDTNILVSMIFFPSSQTRELAKRLSYHELFLYFLVLEIDRPEIMTMKDFLGL